jgi:Fe-S-cluster containining protein
MPTLEQLKELAENLDEREVGLDYTFRFKCHGCGKCCKNREDILLSSKDFFNTAKCLGMKPGDVVEKYCELYVGGNSRIPIIRFRPVGQNKKCPMLQDKRCMVHKAKPAVCALFPLGRFVMFKTEEFDDMNEEDIVIRYMVNPVECGGHRNNTSEKLARFLRARPRRPLVQIMDDNDHETRRLY